MDRFFTIVATRIATAAGQPVVFLLAVLVILAWAVTGPLFGFSDTWQLVVNTGTTIVTFLMVFVIQGAQNRDSRAVHLKLDELLRAVTEARTSMVDLEALTDQELDRLQSEFSALRAHAGEEAARRAAGAERRAEGRRIEDKVRA